MLGEDETQLFTSRISYKHSLRPTTTCTTDDACTVRRFDGQSTWARKEEADTSGLRAVNFAKAMFVAKTWPPDAALERLQRKFTPTLFDEDDGLCLVREELEFQAHAREASLAVSSTGIVHAS